MNPQDSTSVIGRAPLDDPLLAELRTMLDEVEAAPDGWPSTMPPWEQLTAGMRQARRRRRLRRTGQVLGGAVAVTLVCAGVSTGVLPYPSFAPTLQLPMAADHSTLFRQPTRGSLAGDPAWLEAFRQRAAGETPEHEDGGEVWRPPSADKISVLFAGDVGAYRIALVEGDWHWGPIAAPQQVWYSAPAGAAADRMDKGANEEPQDMPAQVFTPGQQPPLLRGAGESVSFLMLSQKPVDVTVQAAPTIDAAARVSRHQTLVPSSEPGVYSAAVKRPGSYQVMVDGRAVAWPFEVAGGGTDPDADLAAIEARSWRPLRGGDRAEVDPLPRTIWEVSRQPLGSGTFRLMVGPSSTRGQQLPVNPYVGVVTLPGGARVVGMGGVFAGDTSTSEFDTATLLPAGPDDDLAVAWRSVEAEFHDRPTWTAAMGPVGTVTVEWLHADGTVSSSLSRDTLAVTVQHDITSVRFLDADGERLTTRPVLKSTGFDTMPQVLAAAATRK